MQTCSLFQTTGRKFSAYGRSDWTCEPERRALSLFHAHFLGVWTGRRYQQDGLNQVQALKLGLVACERRVMVHDFALLSHDRGLASRKPHPQSVLVRHDMRLFSRMTF